MQGVLAKQIRVIIIFVIKDRKISKNSNLQETNRINCGLDVTTQVIL